ncbi:MAG TPA: hypothetical protein VK047_07060 [Zeimonas sp.]|nr:hypothetical protein [Zeimonas sp.]
MKWVLKVFPIGHSLSCALFVLAAFALLAFAAQDFWIALYAYGARSREDRVDAILDGISVLTISLASFELGQTIYEEQVLRETHISAPTRVRRFLSRFLVVLVVALSIETLVAVFRFSRVDPSQLPYAAAVGLTAAALLAAWGAFVQWNRSAELLEPEAMESAKQEDAEVDRRDDGSQEHDATGR